MKTLQDSDTVLNAIVWNILAVLLLALFCMPVANAQTVKSEKQNPKQKIISAAVPVKSISIQSQNKEKKAIHSHTQHFSLVDIALLSADNPAQAIKTFSLKKPARKVACDILIVGGGMGGVSAALKLAQLSASNSRQPRIILTEETDWLGGQITTQGVPALDENRLVETSGATLNYQKLRAAIRNVYRPLLSRTAPEPPHGASRWNFNPGNCWVSRLSFEPKIALAELNHLLEQSARDADLKVLYRLKPFLVKTKPHNSRTSNDSKGQSKDYPIPANQPNKKVTSIYFFDLRKEEIVEIRPKICLDATECGDLLTQANLPYAVGSDSRASTGEPHAPVNADPGNVQDFTYPFVLELRTGENHKIDKPARYDELDTAGKFSLAGYKMFAARTAADGSEILPFWEYRRLIDKNNFTGDKYTHDLAVINWESNDVRGLNIIDRPAKTEAENLAFGKLVSLGFLYWLQNEAPRDEGGKGYPELMLRTDILGTQDGLSKYPYIRESRRAKTKYTITEQDIVASSNRGARAKLFHDSVGIGLYPVDIHGEQEVAGTGQETKPFEIPLGSLLCQDCSNLLPSCKNIGTTHITNGAYRLHPIEWAIGEAQGTLAYLAFRHKASPESFHSDPKKLRQLQKNLIECGAPIYWYDDIATDHAAFPAIQYLAATEIMPGSSDHLHFYPEQLITRAEAMESIARTVFHNESRVKPVQSSHTIADLDGFEQYEQSIKRCLQESIIAVDTSNCVRPGDPLTESDFTKIRQNNSLKAKATDEFGIDTATHVRSQTPPELVSRAEFATWLYTVATSKKHLGNP